MSSHRRAIKEHAQTNKANSQPSTSSAPTASLIAQTSSKQLIKSTKNSVLYLKQNHVTFETPSQKCSVFFDECNREIISLVSGVERSKTRVVFQTTDHSSKIEFLLPIEKRILSIKLNSSRTVLAYHVEKSNIEFVNVQRVPSDGLDSGSTKYVLGDRKYMQASRTKNSKLFGFLWTGPMELIMITDISIEYYHVDSNRHRLKHSKSFQSSTNWFVYQPPISCTSKSSDTPDECSETNIYSILMVSVGSLGNSMQPYMFNRGQVVKLQRFDVEGDWQGGEKLELFERSITIACIYNRVRLLVLQHESLNVKSRGAQILVYTVDPETGLTSKTHTLDLDVSGRFAINIIDNLVVAHDQPTKSSFIFDIMIESTEKSDCPKHFVSFIDSQSIRPLQLASTSEEVAMYSLNWVFFQPNFIIDAKMGLLSTLYLDLELMQDLIQDNLLLLNFLSHRTNSEQIILRKCKEIVANSLKTAVNPASYAVSPLAEVSSFFEVLSRLIISAPRLDKKTTSDKQAKPTIPKPRKVEPIYGTAIAQEDVHREVFKQLEPESCEQPAYVHFATSTLLEFILSIRKLEKDVEFCIYEQLLNCLVSGKKYYQLYQMIRAHIFIDSKQLACLLLSLRTQYKSALRLGLDMLHRLNCLSDLIDSLNLESDLVAQYTSSETSSRLSERLVQSLEVDVI